MCSGLRFDNCKSNHNGLFRRREHRVKLVTFRETIMLTTTETLLQGLAAGNESRWARFYRDYAPFLEGVVARQVPSMSHADAEEIVSETMIAVAKMMPSYSYDREKKGAFHSLLAKIAQNKAIDHCRKEARHAAMLQKLAAEPIVISEADWQRETFDMALRRVFADPTIRESSKIAFRRVVQQGEDVATVAADLGLEPNAIYQIRNRLKERLKNEVRAIQESAPDGI